MTKNTSTPRNPPGSHAELAWYTITATTASARIPSRPGRYGTALTERATRGAGAGMVMVLMRRRDRPGAGRGEPIETPLERRCTLRCERDGFCHDDARCAAA